MYISFKIKTVGVKVSKVKVGRIRIQNTLYLFILMIYLKKI